MLLCAHALLIIVFYWRYLNWVRIAAGPKSAQLRSPSFFTKLYFGLLGTIPLISYISYHQLDSLSNLNMYQLAFLIILVCQALVALLPFAIKVKEPKKLLLYIISFCSVFLIVLYLILGLFCSFDANCIAERPYSPALFIFHFIYFLGVVGLYSKVLEANYGIH